MLRALFLTISLLAVPAAAQTTEPAKQLQIDEAIRAFRTNSTIWPQEWFLLGDGVGLTGMTRVRASERAGICEQDRFEIGTGPDRGPGIPQATEVHATTSYGMMAIESEVDDRSSEDEVAQDLACFRWSQTDRNVARIDARDADIVWFAGQALQALALDARTERKTDWNCVQIDKCPNRERAQAILTAGNLSGVQEIWTGCPDTGHSCLVLEFFDGSDDRWFVKIQPYWADNYRSVSALWSWRDAHLIVD